MTLLRLAARLAGGAAVALCLASAPASAQGFSVSITVDELGHGHFSNTNGFTASLPFDLQADPGPGGLASVLTYSLLNPPGLTSGDVLLFDPVTDVFSDVLRFNGGETCGDGSTGCLAFYSDPLDGIDSLADTPTPPQAFYTNSIDLTEGAITTYTPTAGEPGFVTGADGPVTYNFISNDDHVPEPASLALLGAGLAGFAAARRRKAS